MARRTRRPNLSGQSPSEKFRDVRVGTVTEEQVKRRFSVTSDVLSFRRCARLYGFQADRGYVPSQPTQEFIGTIIHQVLDRAHSHFMGRIDPATKGSIPTDKDIEGFFGQVETALKAHGVRAVGPDVGTHALRIVQAFNRIEGPVLYPLVRDTEHRLQAERPDYLLFGVVDVLASSPNSDDPLDMEIWDYKASKRPDPKTRHGQARLEDYEFQMQVYADLYNLRNGRYPKRAVIYFVGEFGGQPPPSRRPAQAVLEIPLQPAKITKALRVFDETVGDIGRCEESNTWKAPQGGADWAGKETCDLCDVRWSCPEMRGKYPPRNP